MVLGLQIVFSLDFTSDRLAAAASMVLLRKNMGLYVDAARKQHRNGEWEDIPSMNFLSTINRVLEHRYTKGSIFVHHSVFKEAYTSTNEDASLFTQIHSPFALLLAHFQ